MSDYLTHGRYRVSMTPYLWEGENSRKVGDGRGINDIFLEHVTESSLTLVIVVDALRKGTREELELALASPDVELSIVTFDSDAFRANVALQARRHKALKPYEKYVLMNNVGAAPTSDEAWHRLYGIIVEFALRAVTQARLSLADQQMETRG